MIAVSKWNPGLGTALFLALIPSAILLLSGTVLKFYLGGDIDWELLAEDAYTNVLPHGNVCNITLSPDQFYHYLAEFMFEQFNLFPQLLTFHHYLELCFFLKSYIF